MKILFAGTPEPAARVLEYLLEDPQLEVVGVLTQPDARRGRGRSLHPSAVAAVASERGLPVHKFPSLKADNTAAAGAGAAPGGRAAGDAAAGRPEAADSDRAAHGNHADESVPAEDPRAVLQNYAANGVSAIAVVAYGNLIPKDLLEVVEHGWINLHYSVLPRWRGAAPVQAALAAGDSDTGVSVFRIEEGLDTGPVLATQAHPIGLRDTAAELLSALTTVGREVLRTSLLELHAGTARPQPQNESAATHAPKLNPADAQIDWGSDAAVIQQRARAHTPAPGAWTTLRTAADSGNRATAAAPQRYKIGLMLPATPAADVPPLQPGELYATKTQLFVGAGHAEMLEIVQIQPPGKKMMAAADWARGQQALLASRPRFGTEGETGSGEHSDPTTASPA